LSGIRDAINHADAGVTATIVNDGSNTPYRLSISNNVTGKTNSLKLSVAGDPALAALLAHDPSSNSGQALSETATAQNSQLKIDGIDVSKSSNSITDAINGVTLNISKTNVGTPTNLAITRDTATVITSVTAFVKSFNDTTQALKDASAYDPATKTAAILNGESSVRSISNQIRGILSSPVAGNGTTLTLLSQVGVTVQKDGSLGVDSVKLQNAVTNNFGDIAGLFSSVGKTSDALIGYSTSTAKTVPGSYAVSITQLATQGKTTGQAAAGLTITAGVNDSLAIKIDGITSTITLAAGTYANADALATALQSKINGATELSTAGVKATVSASGGVLSITSASYGSTSNALVTGGNGQSNLAFDTGANITVGTDVIGSINGQTAVGTGQNLAGAVGDPSEGLSLLVTGGVLGSRGTVTYTQGYAYQLSKLTDSFLASDGVIAARTDGINASIKDIAKSKGVLSARLVTTEARYRAQFTALDTLISSLSTTSSFLTQQLAAIAKNGA
jgi:flagellar hook-associated protein 2